MEALQKQDDSMFRVEKNTGIKSSLGPFRIMPDYITVYPKVVIEALGKLYKEYNKAFTRLVSANREWEEDYRYCFNDDGVPINWCVQIDMVGLSHEFFDKAKNMPEEDVREILRRRIFEIENSIAVYQLLEKFFARNGNGSFFKTRYRALLKNIRQKFGKPIALLAVTQLKHEAMLAAEFGKAPEEELTNKEVRELSGFDAFWGPEQFRKYLEANNGQCEYLLYVRSSDPITKLKDPSVIVEHPLLGDAETRRIIKANSLTFNIDDPEMNHDRRINDTKDYMPPMGMAFPISSEEDLRSSEFISYIDAQGVEIELEEVMLRCKPAKGVYGCYGHVSGSLKQGKFRSELRRNLQKRGPYVVQPEMQISTVGGYMFIDRNFFAMVDNKPLFVGGVRNLAPAESVDARKRRIHGSNSAVYAEIVD